METKQEKQAKCYLLIKEIEKRQRQIQQLNTECHLINEQIIQIEKEIEKDANDSANQ